jgi:hypothetical protein
MRQKEGQDKALLEESIRATSQEGVYFSQVVPRVPVGHSHHTACFFVNPLSTWVLTWQLSMVALFTMTTQFADEYMPSNLPSAKTETSTTKGAHYPMFQDTHVMMAIGFGFLYTGMRRYAWSGVGINYLLCACTLQWAILCNGFWNNIVALHDAKPGFKIPLDLEAVINGDYVVATVLISFGALIGRLSPTQAVWMSFVETIFCTANVALAAALGVSDAGDPCCPVFWPCTSADNERIFLHSRFNLYICNRRLHGDPHIWSIVWPCLCHDSWRQSIQSCAKDRKRRGCSWHVTA